MQNPSVRGLALADHYLDVGRPARALEVLEGVGSDELEHAWYWELRAQALVDLERFGDAAEAARSGLELDGESITLLDALCIAEWKLGNLDRAESAILTALRLEPEIPSLLCRYAHLLADGRELAKAQRVLAKAERLAPDAPEVIRCRMVLAYMRGDDREAKRQSERLLAVVDPEDPAGHAMLGAQHAFRGSLGRASRHYDTAARYDLADHELADLAREGRIEAHWLFWPIRPIERFGPAVVWVAAVGTFALLGALELYTLLTVVAVAYVALCIYSWVVPPLARRWLGRRYT